MEELERLNIERYIEPYLQGIGWERAARINEDASPETHGVFLSYGADEVHDSSKV